jgi:hypothetical protein
MGGERFLDGVAFGFSPPWFVLSKFLFWKNLNEVLKV